MRTIRRALAATAVAGAFTASLLAGAAPAAASEGTNAFDYYYGYGSGSSSSQALYFAENDAKWKAQLGGYDVFWDCRVISQHVTQLSEFSYSANVTLYCYNYS